MKPVWLPGVSHEAKFTALAILAGVLLVGAGWVGNSYRRAATITRTVTHRVSIQEQYGRPDKTVAGPSGLTCDVYQQRQVILCHR